MSNELFTVDSLLSGALKNEGLSELFQHKLDELKLNKTQVQEILGIPYRTLHGILEGTLTLIDITNLVKISDFLHIPKEQAFRLYIESVQKKRPISDASTKKIKFIKDNFDLIVLKKAGLINGLTDFIHIENRIVSRLGLKSIFEYKKPDVDIAFSSGLFKPKNILTRLFWIKCAKCELEEILNPHEFDKQALINYFPSIGWHSMNVERGLKEVVMALFKIGVTVIYLPSLQGLQLRGATFNVNGKPCIVLTNYRGFYSTLWHCLLHELYHVLFDWEDIKNNSYHLTDDDNLELTVQEREKFADDFASEFLLSSEKLAIIKKRIKEDFYVEKFANENDVHKSIIYALHAHKTKEPKDWAKVKKVSPTVFEAVRDLDYPWTDETPLVEFVSDKKALLYN